MHMDLKNTVIRTIVSLFSTWAIDSVCKQTQRFIFGVFSMRIEYILQT